MSSTHSICVEMKRGGRMLLDVSGHCYTDSDGAGQRFDVIEDIEIFWPAKKNDKKRYSVKDELIKDLDQVKQAFWDAEVSAAHIAEADHNDRYEED